ncbi:MAG: winged helix-turn-helix domain-containing protein [Planctomycetota bacterium]
MSASTQIKVTAEFILLHLEGYGDMTLRNLRSSMLVNDNLFNQGIGWLAREGKILLTNEGWKAMVSLVK